jgi:hypothetical protein
MSGDDELDKLLSSLSSPANKKKKSAAKKDQAASEQPAQKRKDSTETAGVDPLDVVELTGQQRKVVTWLSRHQRSSFAEIQEALAIPPQELQDLLDQLLEGKQIRAAKRKGQFQYSVPIHGRASRRLRGFPEDLWKKAGLDDD